MKSCRCLLSGLMELRPMETHFKLSTRENGIGQHNRKPIGDLRHGWIQVQKWYQEQYLTLHLLALVPSVLTFLPTSHMVAKRHPTPGLLPSSLTAPWVASAFPTIKLGHDTSRPGCIIISRTLNQDPRHPLPASQLPSTGRLFCLFPPRPRWPHDPQF